MIERIKCTNCKGTGLIPGFGCRKYVKCPICNGTGKKSRTVKEPNKSHK